jgi:hypothetical protein
MPVGEGASLVREETSFVKWETRLVRWQAKLVRGRGIESRDRMSNVDRWTSNAGTTGMNVREETGFVSCLTNDAPSLTCIPGNRTSNAVARTSIPRRPESIPRARANDARELTSPAFVFTSLAFLFTSDVFEVTKAPRERWGFGTLKSDAVPGTWKKSTACR